MSFNPLHKIVLRSFLRQARTLKRENACIWLQNFPQIQEFQTSSTNPSAAHIKTFVDQFPEPIHDFLMDNISNRRLDSGELRRIARAAFQINPLRGRDDATDHALTCMKVMNNQVYYSFQYHIYRNKVLISLLSRRNGFKRAQASKLPAA